MPLFLAPLVAWLGALFTGTMAPFLFGFFMMLVAWLLLFFVGFVVLIFDCTTGWITNLLFFAWDLFMSIAARFTRVVVEQLPVVEVGSDPGVYSLMVELASFMAWANRYVPLSETVLLFALMTSIFGALWLLRIMSTVRGAR
jgi:hypothetical protein